MTPHYPCGLFHAGNAVADEGAVALAEALKVNKTLNALYLGGTLARPSVFNYVLFAFSHLLALSLAARSIFLFETPYLSNINFDLLHSFL